jgi:hypothetical protein
MGVPPSEVGYTSARAGRADHEVLKGHVVALRKKGLSGQTEDNFKVLQIFVNYIK